MKTVIFYGRRNTGMALLPYLVAKGFLVKVISDDQTMLWIAESLGLEMVTIETMGSEFDLFLCCHGNSIIQKEYLIEHRFVNIHPCLDKYKGKDPVSKYMNNTDTLASVSSHYMIEKVDEGEIIYSEYFQTPEIRTYAEFYNIALYYYFKVLDKTLELLKL